MIFFSRLVFSNFILVLVFGFHVNILRSQDHESGKKNSNICYSCNVLALDQICENFDLVPEGNVFPWMGTESTFTGTENSSSKIVPSLDLNSPYPINSVLQILQGGNASMQIERTMDIAPARVEFLMFVPSGKAGAFQLWINSTFIPPVDVLINNGVLKWGELQFPFYSHDQWFRVAMIVQPLESEIELFVNDIYIGKKSILADANTEVSFVRFYTPAVSGIFDAMYDHVSYTKVFVNEPLCNSSGSSPVKITGLGTLGCSDFYNIVCANNLGYTDCETVNGSCPNVIDCPEEITPKDAATNVSLNPIIQWVGGGQATEFRISLGYSPSNFDIANNISVGAQTYYSASGLMPSKKVYVKLEVIGNGSSKICTTSFTTRADDCRLPCDFGYQVRDCESFEYYPTGSGKMFPEAKYKFEFNQANDVNNINVTNFSPVPGTQGSILELQKKYTVAYKIERTPGNGKHIRIDCQFSLPAGATGNIGLERKSNSPSLFIRMNNGVAQFLGLSTNILPYNQGVWNRLIIFGDVEKKTLHFYINNKLLIVLENQDVSFIKNLTFFSNSTLSTDKMFVDNIGYREREYINTLFHMDRDAPNDGFNEQHAVNYLNRIDTLRVFADRDSSFIKIYDKSIKERIGLADILELKVTSNKTFEGKINLEEKTDDSRIFKLNHPDYVYGDKFNDEFTLSLFDTRSQCICDTQKLEVYPAPLLLIHGINSDPSAFNNLRVAFIFNYLFRGAKYLTGDPRTIFLWDLNYSNSTDEHISKNARLLTKTINKMKEFYKVHKQIPLGKIDVVSHSMGGLMTRFYVQDSSFNNDINRFITINTPHQGTQFANYGTLCNPHGNDQKCKDVICKVFGGCLTNLAVQDLRTDSDLIRKINSNSINDYNILSHAIVSHSIEPNDFKSDFLQFCLEEFRNDLYNGEQNDLVVPLSSQLGGLDGFFKSEFPNLSHLESTDNAQVIKRVYDLLNIADLKNNFSKKWFKNGSLTFKCPNGSEPNIGTNDIDIPAVNSNFIFGQPIQINYQIPTNYTDYSVLSNLKLDQVSRTSCNVNAWDNSLGYHKIFAIGMDNTNKLESVDSLEIYIGPGNFLQSIASYPSELEVRHRDSIKFKLYAFLRDSVVEITDYQNTQYQFATNRVKNKDYSVTGLEIGVDTIMVTYYGKTIKIPVKVIPTPCKYQYKPNVVRSSSDILCEGEELGLTIVDDFLINDWNNFTQEDQIQIYKDTTIVIYMFDTLLCGYYDTLHFNFKKSEDINLSGDTKKCNGENFVVSVANPGSTVTWSDGTTGNILSTTSSGTFIVNVTGQNGCTSKDTIHLEYFPDIVAEILSNSSTNVLCKGDTLILSASGGNAYQWNNGSTSNSIIVVEGGEYEVEVTDSNGCSAKDSIQVNKSNISLDLGEDVQASGSFYIIQAPVLSNVTYKWSSNGSTSDNLIVITSGTYYLTITDHLGCTAVDSIFIDFVSKTSDKPINNFQIFPNPGSDDLFILLEQVPSDPIKLQILNSNGQIIREEVLNRDVSRIDTSELSPGMFILQCVVNKTVINRTWIKI
jgi:hypothetical protein